jgi:hypothetical protein
MFLWCAARDLIGLFSAMTQSLVIAPTALSGLFAEGDGSALGGLIIQLGFASAIAYVPLQVYTVRGWHAGWRIAACVPLALMVPVFAYTAYALARQSNLWPIVLIFLAPLGTGYLLVLVALRRFLGVRA